MVYTSATSEEGLQVHWLLCFVYRCKTKRIYTSSSPNDLSYRYIMYCLDNVIYWKNIYKSLLYSGQKATKFLLPKSKVSSAAYCLTLICPKTAGVLRLLLLQYSILVSCIKLAISKYSLRENIKTSRPRPHTLTALLHFIYIIMPMYNIVVMVGSRWAIAMYLRRQIMCSLFLLSCFSQPAVYTHTQREITVNHRCNFRYTERRIRKVKRATACSLFFLHWMWPPHTPQIIHIFEKSFQPQFI